MNRRMVCHTVGLIVLLEAVLMLPSLVTSLIYKNSCIQAFIWSILIALLLGGAMVAVARPRTKVLYAKEGFAITSLAWLFVSLVGALPFFLSKQIPNFIDAFFETVSGFTTTGASILNDVTALDKGLLFWRSFTHWVGGMGVLVFLMVFLSSFSDRTIHIIRAEMPGPTVGKLLPKVKDTAKILYIIYLVMTALLVIALLLSKMPLFDSLIHAFGTAGTGGFGIYSDSAASLTAAQQWIIAIGMLLFGINFNLYYLILIRRFRSAIRSTELWVYFGLVASAVTLCCINLSNVYHNISDLIRHSFFQVSSIVTTTGFSTVDFNLWPNLSKTVLLLLMFFGACAGSTAGGFKISRVILLFKNCGAEFRHLLHPRSINVLRFEGKSVESETRKSVTGYLALYTLCFFIIFFLVSFDSFDIETNFSAVAACFNNIGPGLGGVGPMSNYAAYSGFSKIMLSLAMLLGRLEIWPIIMTLVPSTWRGWRA
ncbi:MAG: TrkH family potassium uptake protein [Ruminococcaceae bacterium]|nr:TrkH family potassium uptake protein [Oscillospiraceae bacterium]